MDWSQILNGTITRIVIRRETMEEPPSPHEPLPFCSEAGIFLDPRLSIGHSDDGDPIVVV